MKGAGSTEHSYYGAANAGFDCRAATEHRVIQAPGRAGAQGEQHCRVRGEASRGNPGTALWGFAEGGMVLFLCLPSLICVYDDDATYPT